MKIIELLKFYKKWCNKFDEIFKEQVAHVEDIEYNKVIKQEPDKFECATTDCERCGTGSCSNDGECWDYLEP